MRDTVFDSYAVLGVLFEEPSAVAVAVLLNEARESGKAIAMCSVNWAEVLYRAQRMRGMEGVKAAHAFQNEVQLEIVAADVALAELAAEFKAVYPMSLADCFAAALAVSRNAQLATGDPEFEAVEDKLKLLWLPKKTS